MTGPTAIEEADLTVAEKVGQLFERVGRVDLLVNTAGYHSSAGCLEIGDDEWQASQATTVKSYFLTCQTAGRVWRHQGAAGTIVNVAWWDNPRGASLAPNAGRQVRGGGGAVYGVTKHAARTMTQVMALELARYQITVNGIGPGAVVTNVLKHLPPDEEAAHRASPDQVPLGRQSTAEDIAGTAVFLASDDAAFITGVTINVDGGLSAAAIDRPPPGGIW